MTERTRGAGVQGSVRQRVESALATAGGSGRSTLQRKKDAVCLSPCGGMCSKICSQQCAAFSLAGAVRSMAVDLSRPRALPPSGSVSARASTHQSKDDLDNFRNDCSCPRAHRGARRCASSIDERNPRLASTFVCAPRCCTIFRLHAQATSSALLNLTRRSWQQPAADAVRSSSESAQVELAGCRCQPISTSARFCRLFTARSEWRRECASD